MQFIACLFLLHRLVLINPNASLNRSSRSFYNDKNWNWKKLYNNTSIINSNIYGCSNKDNLGEMEYHFFSTPPPPPLIKNISHLQSFESSPSRQQGNYIYIDVPPLPDNFHLKTPQYRMYMHVWLSVFKNLRNLPAFEQLVYSYHVYHVHILLFYSDVYLFPSKEWIELKFNNVSWHHSRMKHLPDYNVYLEM